MVSRRLTLLAIACLDCFAPHLAEAANVQYTITQISAPDTSSNVAAAINQRGQVAGYATGPGYSALMYLYSAGQFTYPDTLGAKWIWISGINDAGHFVGSYVVGDNHDRAFAWIDGVTMDLGDLGSGEARGTAIDNRNIVYGASGHAFAWRNGHMLDLGGWKGAEETAINGINAYGVAVGQFGGLNGTYSHAFMVRGKQRIDLPTLGGVYSAARDVNDHGVVCGWAEASSGKVHAFRYQNGKIADLGILPGGVRSAAWAINNAGDIVGEASSPRGQRAVIVRAGSTVMEDLNDLADAKAHRWRLEGALDINDRGEIVGYGNRGGFLLTPIEGVGAEADDN